MMRGYLLKEKSKATAFGGDTNKRWFQIERSSSTGELILCYYKSPPSTNEDRRGWLFISDIISCVEDEVCKWITIVTKTKTLRLQAMERSDHRKWFEKLRCLCHGENGGGDEYDDVSSAGGEQQLEQQGGKVELFPNRIGDKDTVSEDITENMSQSEIEISFIRKITGSAANSSNRVNVAIPPKKLPSLRKPSSALGRDEKERPKSDGRHVNGASSIPINGEPVNKRVERAMTNTNNIPTCESSTIPAAGSRASRRLPAFNSDSSDCTSCSVSNDNNITSTSMFARSFADLEEEVTSPGGLERFMIQTKRANFLDDSSQFPAKGSQRPGISSRKEEIGLKKVTGMKEKYSGYVHPSICPDKNFATEDWDESESSSSEDSYGGVW